VYNMFIPKENMLQFEDRLKSPGMLSRRLSVGCNISKLPDAANKNCQRASHRTSFKIIGSCNRKGNCHVLIMMSVYRTAQILISPSQI
jgi:hypothetical protein